jgi:hypothetical protein
VGWELLAGAGLHHVPRDLQNTRASMTFSSPADTVSLRANGFRRAWAPQLTLGVTARLRYHQREWAFLTAYLVQGLTDLVTYEVRRSGSGQAAPLLRGRGSALGVTVGVPLRLYSWPARS